MRWGGKRLFTARRHLPLPLPRPRAIKPAGEGAKKHYGKRGGGNGRGHESCDKSLPHARSYQKSK